MGKDTVLITGASSGIGEALAANFAQGGYDLVLVARSENKLQALASQLERDTGAGVKVEPVDLSRRGAAKRLASSMSEQGIEVDILVNSAGVLEHGRFNEIPGTAQQAMIELNISGLTNMLGQFLPPMVKRGKGRILNVASIAARTQPGDLCGHQGLCTVAIGITFGRTGGYRCLNYCVVPGRYCYQYGGHRPGKWRTQVSRLLRRRRAARSSPGLPRLPQGRRDLCPRGGKLGGDLNRESRTKMAPAPDFRSNGPLHTKQEIAPGAGVRAGFWRGSEMCEFRQAGGAA